MPGAVVHYFLHRVYSFGGLHDGLMLAAIVELNGHAAGLDVLPDIVPGVENAAGAVVFIPPCSGAVPVLRDDLRLAGAEGDRQHILRQGDLNFSGIAGIPGHDIHHTGREGRILQAEVFVAQLLAALHGGHTLLGEAAVLHGQLHVLLCGNGDFQQGLVILLVGAYRKGNVRAVGLDIGNGVARVDAEGNALLLAGGVLELVGGPARHGAGIGVRKHLSGAADKSDALGIGDLIEGHHRQIRVAVVDEGLGGIGGAGTGQQRQGDGRAVDPPHAPGQGAENTLSILPDAEIGDCPNPGQCKEPGEAHPGHRPEHTEVGEVIGQSPHAGIEPAQLPVCRPHCQAQGAEGDEQDDGEIRPAGELVGCGRRQDAQGQRQPHEQQIGQHIVCAGEHGADQPCADREPDQHGEACGQHRRGQQGQQARQGRGQGRHYRVGEDVHPAAAGPVQLKDGQQAEEDGPGHTPCNSGIGQIHGEHGGGCGGLVKHQPQHRGEDRQQKDQPGQAALK